MKKKIVLILLAVCVLTGSFAKSKKQKAKYENYQIEYYDESAETVEGLVAFLDEHLEIIHDFFGIEKLKKPAKIVIYPTLEEWKKWYSLNGKEYKEWMVGQASEGTIRMLEFKERARLESHKTDTIDDFNKTVLHEYTHLCHQQVKKSDGSRLFVEGLAHYLANQRYEKINLNKIKNLEDYFDRAKFNSLAGNYSVAHNIVEIMIANMPNEEIMEYVIHGKKFDKDKDKIKALLIDAPKKPVEKFELSDLGIKADGVLLAKTDEVTVSSSTTKIEGKGNAGVFTEGRTVTLSPFIMGKYEVTQELYRKVMNGQKVTADGVEYMLNSDPAFNYATFDDLDFCPVEGINWYAAVYFCNVLSEKLGVTKAYEIEIKKVDTKNFVYISSATVTPVSGANGYRLPTEAEWEFAARGGNPKSEAWNYKYSGSNNFDDVGWDMKKEKRTHEVGKKVANSLGLYDMCGNVAEWCYDAISSVSPGSVTDPFDGGAERVMYGFRVQRGGTHTMPDDPSGSFEVTTRSNCSIADSSGNIGIRLVRSL